MYQQGFIRNEAEIRFLILYIAARLDEPAAFDALQELTMCDPAIDCFQFLACLNQLVQSGHISHSEKDTYAITDKGRVNGHACENELPYSVRLTADRLTRDWNRKQKRQKQVRFSAAPLARGMYRVTFSLGDDNGRPFWRMELTVPNKEQLDILQRNFDTAPELLYSKIIALLFRQPEEKSDEKGEKKEEDAEKKKA